MDFKIIKRVFLNDTQGAIKTKHMVYGKVMTKPYQLQIIQYPGEKNVYLFYCDKEGHEITDSFHENIQDAMSQAEWEFDIRESDWEDG
ncbi:hypothetical protein [Candidatus Odyssella acanthamoebae]|uniref:hypothetical protein n=1 Tax=Candidatus Odyssella acanthamoebae TaxID=91604 RepID=UPI00068B3B7A|nr:hypothetical protein [Candidatus Paracaedibacter acanthamoebae]